MSQPTNRLRAYLLRVGQWLRPISGPFNWWRAFSYRRTIVVLLPDSTAIFMAVLGGFWFLPYLRWGFAWLYCVMLIVSPFVFLVALLIRGSEVKVVRLLGPIPYWIHDIPAEATFDRYEAWEDSAPSGVSFNAGASNPLHLGTALSAEPLYRHISTILGKAGWQQTALGWLRP